MLYCTIRSKLYALLSLPIVALIGLWMFVTGHVIGDFFQLRQAATLYERVAVPSTALVIAVQNERKLSAVTLSGTVGQKPGLSDVRNLTDAAVTAFRRQATSMEAMTTTGSEVRVAIAQVVAEADKLPTLRADVDARVSDRLRAVQSFSRVVDAVYRLQDRLVTASNVDLYQQAIGLQRIAHARDMMSREDALIAGATLAGTLPREEYKAIEVIAPNRLLLLTEGTATLDDELRGPFDTLLASAQHQKLISLEEEIVETSRLPVERALWNSVAADLGGSMDRLLATRSRLLNGRVDDAAGWIIAEIVIAGGFGLAAIVGVVVLSARFGGGLARELGELRRTALELAETRLPKVVEQLRGGEAVDVGVSVPPIVTKGCTLEIVDISRAFSTVQRTAVESAAGEARLRLGFNQVFHNLARRNQALVHRQLAQLDAMQRKASEPEVLEDLNRLDHLTARMRRKAEGLIILSGAAAGGTWRNPAPLPDVVYAAVAEVEDYRRITVFPMPDGIRLTGSATADVTLLLAELLENATVFSPPNTQVNIRGESVARGFVLEIEDRGLGLQDRECEEINERLANPPEVNLIDSEQLGLFVVSRLAARHGIKVTLNRSAFGGATAVVLIPRALLDAPEEIPPAPPLIPPLEFPQQSSR
ncbi:nitrate- and nitrite sensing domain-containing protein [Streptosporangium sp. NPDC004631]